MESCPSDLCWIKYFFLRNNYNILLTLLFKLFVKLNTLIYNIYIFLINLLRTSPRTVCYCKSRTLIYKFPNSKVVIFFCWETQSSNIRCIEFFTILYKTINCEWNITITWINQYRTLLLMGTPYYYARQITSIIVKKKKE